MFDCERLFKVLYHISIEESAFLIAQDAHSTIRACINQIEDIDTVIDDLQRKLYSLEAGYEREISDHIECIDKLQRLKDKSSMWLDILAPLCDESENFWCCSPVDHTRCLSENKAALDDWRQYREGGLPEGVMKRVREFQDNCRTVLHSHFKDLLTVIDEEIKIEQEGWTRLRNRQTRLLNALPLSLVPEFDRINHSFVGSSRFPVTHYHNVDPHFATLLGYSIARMFAFPLLSFGVNTKETDAVAQQLAGTSERKPTVAILFYRTVTRQVVGVHWEITFNALDNTHYARGVDVTQEIEASRLKQAVSIQKMLRQWLHSIRNASFEQQAKVILEEVKALAKKPQCKDLDEEFESVYESIKLLIHTSKTTVGLIDQALDTKGLTMHMCVMDFVNSMVAFPHHFAQAEGIQALYTQFKFTLNGREAQPQDFAAIFAAGEIINVQSIVDNVISNAVRYTDPVLGIRIEMTLTQHDNSLLFMLAVTDHAPGGLPPHAFKFLQENLGTSKCLQVGSAGSPTYKNSGVGRGRSSCTGLPHVVDLYLQLTQSGKDDFDMTVSTSGAGSTFRVRFALDLMAPTSTELPPQSHRAGQSINGCILVVDDSLVIRKIIGRYLNSMNCHHHVCVDGAEAWEWFLQHSDICAGVITDLEMPKMGGDALIANIRLSRPDIPCFIVSGNDISPENLPHGARRAIVKPITSDQVASILCEVYTTQHANI